MGNCLADADVVHHGPVEVEREVEDADTWGALHDEVGIGLQSRQIGGRWHEHHVGLAGT